MKKLLILISLMGAVNSNAAEVCSVFKDGNPYGSSDFQLDCTVDDDSKLTPDVRSGSEIKLIKYMTEKGYELKAQTIRAHGAVPFHEASRVWTFVKP